MGSWSANTGIGPRVTVVAGARAIVVARFSVLEFAGERHRAVASHRPRTRRRRIGIVRVERKGCASTDGTSNRTALTLGGTCRRATNAVDAEAARALV